MGRQQVGVFGEWDHFPPTFESVPKLIDCGVRICDTDTFDIIS